MNSEQQHVLEEVPAPYRRTFERAFAGKSRAAGVKSFCLACVGYVRADVRDCTSRGCALHAFRPFQRDSEADDAEPTP